MSERRNRIVGVLFRSADIDSSDYGKAALDLLLRIVGRRRLIVCCLKGGDVYYEDADYCIAIELEDPRLAREIKTLVRGATDQGLAARPDRIIMDAEVPLSTLLDIAI